MASQDCYVDGNDWSAGNDAYRDDHPVMQFVGKQLEIMRMEGTSKKEARRGGPAGEGRICSMVADFGMVTTCHNYTSNVL